MNTHSNTQYSAPGWEHLLTQYFIPGRVELHGDSPGGQLQCQARINHVWLAQLSLYPQTIAHAPHHLGMLSREEQASVIAHVVIDGAGFIDQGGVCLPFAAGDISFRNLVEPSRVVFDTPGNVYAVRLPVTVMPAPRPDQTGHRGLAPRVVHAASLPAEALRRLLSGVATHGMAGVSEYCVSSALPWLFAAAYHGDETAPTTTGATNTMRWQQALDYIEHHLFDAEGLSVMACAQAIGVSQRYLHRLFSQRGQRFSSTVQQRRLEAARTLLQTSSFRTQLIASVAYQCGFQDPAHFSRLFRQRFGMSPRECRIRSGVDPVSVTAG